MPQGGSVTLASLLPLMIYAYMYGPRKGVLAGFIYGILQAIQDPWIIHPAQFLLDYPLAFACIGTAGLFARVKPLQKFPQIKFALGAIVAAVLRYASHVLSGTFAFSTTPGSGDAWIYSLAYNSFVFVDLAIVIVVGILVFSVPSFVKTVDRVQANAIAKKSETSEKAETV
jgi:thiamine transporter